MRKIKQLEQRIEQLEKVVQTLLNEKQQEHDRLNPPTLGGRKRV